MLLDDGAASTRIWLNVKSRSVTLRNKAAPFNQHLQANAAHLLRRTQNVRLVDLG
jgi:hypothetical protein